MKQCEKDMYRLLRKLKESGKNLDTVFIPITAPQKNNSRPGGVAY
jgi:hypothetical protein